MTDKIKEILDKSNLGIISFGYFELSVENSSSFSRAQVGYRTDQYGNDLTNNSSGGWNKDWYVIASDEGNPFFIDLATSKIYTALHGNGSWNPRLLANSLDQFLDILKKLNELSINRKNPIELEKNPISLVEYEEFKNFIVHELGQDFSEWEPWVEIEDSETPDIPNSSNGNLFSKLFRKNK